jgi:hypothetical protein
MTTKKILWGAQKLNYLNIIPAFTIGSKRFSLSAVNVKKFTT